MPVFVDNLEGPVSISPLLPILRKWSKRVGIANTITRMEAYHSLSKHPLVVPRDQDRTDSRQSEHCTGAALAVTNSHGSRHGASEVQLTPVNSGSQLRHDSISGIVDDEAGACASDRVVTRDSGDGPLERIRQHDRVRIRGPHKLNTKQVCQHDGED